MADTEILAGQATAHAEQPALAELVGRMSQLLVISCRMPRLVALSSTTSRRKPTMQVCGSGLVRGATCGKRKRAVK